MFQVALLSETSPSLRIPTCASLLNGTADPDDLHRLLQAIDCLHSALVSARSIMQDSPQFSGVIDGCDHLMGDLNRHLGLPGGKPPPSASDLGD